MDKNVSIQYSGLNAMREMNAVVDGLKTVRVTDFAGIKVEAIRDYSAGKRTAADGTVTEMDIPKCNCVYYELDGGSFVCVRPSGTEPKLKLYFSVKGENKEQAEIRQQAIRNTLAAKIPE